MPAEDVFTESHMAKKYNELLYDALMRCNMTGFILESSPHFDHLQAYVASIHLLYRNTFMLFYNVSLGSEKNKINLAAKLYDKMQDIKKKMRQMKQNPKMVSRQAFEEVEEECYVVQMLINDGLQSLHMFVRIGIADIKGENSVFYWDTKESFKKGNLPSNIASNEGMTNYFANKPKTKEIDYLGKGPTKRQEVDSFFIR